MLRDDDPLMTRVRRRVHAGEKTAAIHQFITEHSDKRVTKKDVYNVIQRIQKEGRGTDDEENSESDSAQQCGEPSTSGEESRELTYEEKYAEIKPLCDAICEKIAELDGDDFHAAMRTFEFFRDYVVSMKDSTEILSFPEYLESLGLILASRPISRQK
ncbi:hypothetical protein Poli38472_011547 [Pythium oligandrum]|uniref:Uncharacterized protein n=1 Tax=Pythium oligandrum TaxID=41045 RepID=A0A8K1FMA8_PYTOL|nr:hypothetical protein Poli38472_011547 [Pythium oligandrum]|eukprot:TMW64667.1 hypothetical protein Poli38472_011547 [Pythium oligandrum]